MKLIIIGATGFVGSEIVRQSLLRNDVTSVIAVSRRPLPSPPKEIDVTKLKSVVIKDYDEYSDEAKKEFVGANACIWTVAITPSKSSRYSADEVLRVCQTSTLVGLRVMQDAGVAKPFRFIYMSGIAAERDQTKMPSFKPEYSKMRGETENKVLAFAEDYKGEIEVTVAKPGLITERWSIGRIMLATAMSWIASLPYISVIQISMAMLDQVVNGFEKNPLLNDDLIRIAENTKYKV